jgi:hypothetical protein
MGIPYDRKIKCVIDVTIIINCVIKKQVKACTLFKV